MSPQPVAVTHATDDTDSVEEYLPILYWTLRSIGCSELVLGLPKDLSSETWDSTNLTREIKWQ